jgi:hypothetical protein
MAHITAGYGVPVESLTYTGPVVFDRLRVAIGDTVVDYPLGGGEVALVASAASLPPVEWFADPQLDGPTALTVEDSGRVYGHLAAWNTCHTGMPGRCVTAPRSRSGYAYFMVHATRAQDGDGNPVTVPVGYGTMSRTPGEGGHAGISLSAQETASHYDNTCTAVFELAAGEDEHGIWVAGQLMPGLDEETRHKAFGAVFSGDWRPIRGNRELMAALAVNTPGFPVTRALVADGQPLALVAAGIVPQPEPDAQPESTVSVTMPEGYAEILDWVRDQKLSSRHAALAEELDALLAGVEVIETLSLDHQLFEASVDMLLALEADHPWLADDVELVDDGDGQGAGEAVLTAAGRKVLHLPKYIKRISKHLRAKGMAQGRAIATAVNAAKKMCATGDTSLPGKQDINPGSKAEACAAVAQWKKDRPGAR